MEITTLIQHYLKQQRDLQTLLCKYRLSEELLYDKS